MPIRIKVDENLPDQIADVFNAHGYDAVTVGDQGWQGLANDELWRRIQAEGRWLVTAQGIRRYQALSPRQSCRLDPASIIAGEPGRLFAPCGKGANADQIRRD